MTDNPYLDSVYRNLPRLLALFDTDESSRTYGYGDRFHWGWNLIDFSNATFQGAAHGLARLAANELLPEWVSLESILERIDAIFIATQHIVRTDGSLEEAFPFEGSYCVTALVAYDLLCAIELISKHLDEEKITHYLSTVAPLVAFLRKSDETHAFISNHLATAVAALYLWAKLSSDSDTHKAQELLQRILDNQSEEGWFLEYDGADPGYQSLCTYYLSDVYRITQDKNLWNALIKSLSFLKFFVHPDGSFGGVYGSRNTRFYYPSGIEFLSQCNLDDASAISYFMRKNIADNKVVTLDAIDEPNFMPMFNSYCWAAAIYSESQGQSRQDELPFLPIHAESDFSKDYEKAGIYLRKSNHSYTIVSYKKGGVVYHFENESLSFLNCGALFTDEKGRVFSTQFWDSNPSVIKKDNVLIVKSSIHEHTKKQLTPFLMAALRAMNISLMRNFYVREMVKKLMVKVLIKGKAKSFGNNKRTIDLGETVSVTDEAQSVAGLVQQTDINRFVSIHMASKGYWQRQDTE